MVSKELRNVLLNNSEHIKVCAVHIGLCVSLSKRGLTDGFIFQVITVYSFTFNCILNPNPNSISLALVTNPQTVLQNMLRNSNF